MKTLACVLVAVAICVAVVAMFPDQIGSAWSDLEFVVWRFCYVRGWPTIIL